jgi:hypothetical protein
MPSIKSSLKIRRAFFPHGGSWQQNSIDIFKTTIFNPHKVTIYYSFLYQNQQKLALINERLNKKIISIGLALPVRFLAG